MIHQKIPEIGFNLHQDGKKTRKGNRENIVKGVSQKKFSIRAAKMRPRRTGERKVGFNPEKLHQGSKKAMVNPCWH